MKLFKRENKNHFTGVNKMVPLGLGVRANNDSPQRDNERANYYSPQQNKRTKIK